MAKITAIGHLGFNVKDMDETIKFYTKALGFKYGFTIEKDGKPWIEYYKACDNQFFEFFYGGSEDAPAAGQSYAHVCLEVDDMEAYVKQIEAAGYELDIRPKMGGDGNIQAWVVDPDGNRIELMQMSPTSKQRTC